MAFSTKSSQEQYMQRGGWYDVPMHSLHYGSVVRVIFFFALLVALCAPLLVFGQEGLVPCDGPECDFGHLMELIQDILNFLIAIAIPIAAVMFAYAGWLYLSGGGNQEKIKQAHKIFGSVVIGIVLVLTAWLIVNTLLSVLTGQGFNERDRQLRVPSEGS